MDKLQLRLTQQQAADLIESLDTALTRNPPMGTRARMIELRAWLAYRATRMWPPAASTANPGPGRRAS